MPHPAVWSMDNKSPMLRNLREGPNVPETHGQERPQANYSSQYQHHSKAQMGRPQWAGEHDQSNQRKLRDH